jgi:hypothetical protein
MSVQTRRKVWDFRGAYSPPAVASRLGDWCSKTTGSCTVKSVSGGSIDLALDATSEVQNACLYMGDILPFDIDDLIRVEFLAKLSTASLAAAVSGVLGLGTARSDTLDSVTNNCWFRFDGSNALLCETDDNTSTYDLDDKATGFNLSTTYRRLIMDFSTGLKTQSPPSLSKGGTADVKFYVFNDKGALTQVAKTVNFDLSAFTSNLQLIAQIQKTSGTAVGTLSILEAAVEYRLPG